MVEERGHEIVVQSLDVEREDGESGLVGRSVEVDSRMWERRWVAFCASASSCSRITLGSEHLFEQEGHSGSQVSRDRRRAALLALVEPLCVVDVLAVEPADVVHRAAAGPFWDLTAEESAIGNENPRGVGASHEFARETKIASIRASGSAGCMWMGT